MPEAGSSARGQEPAILRAVPRNRAEEEGTDLWAIPAGLARDGGGPIARVPKYGSAVSTIYSVSTVDRLDAPGRTGNVRRLVESDDGDCTTSGTPDPRTPGHLS